MSTEFINNPININKKNVSINKVNINELKKKIIIRQKKEKLHKKIILLTVLASVTAAGYLMI